DENLRLFLDPLLISVGAVGYFLLVELLFNGPHGTAELVDLTDIFLGPVFHFIGERLDEIGAAAGVDGVCDAGLIREELLWTQSEARGIFGGVRNWLITA